VRFDVSRARAQVTGVKRLQRQELSCSGNLDTFNRIRKGKGRHGDGTVTAIYGFEF
jgi:hypothetical protein